MTPRPFRLRGEQERRRFLVGMATTADMRHATTTLIAATGRGLDARFELGSHVFAILPNWLTEMMPRLTSGTATLDEVRQASDELTDIFAELLIELSGREQAAWPAVLLAGVLPPLPYHSCKTTAGGELPYDACRLAEVSGLNIVSHFTGRDIAVGGRGQPLDALPLWLLARHLDEPRLLVDVRNPPRSLWLPSARDPDGPNRIQHVAISADQSFADAVCQRLAARPEVRTVVIIGTTADELAIQRFDNLPERLLSGSGPEVLIDAALWNLAGDAIPAISAAILAQLYQDQMSGNVPALTGASAPRVLGQLTPGNLLACNRLQRDLAFARPPIAPLRAAM